MNEENKLIYVLIYLQWELHEIIVSTFRSLCAVGIALDR